MDEKWSIDKLDRDHVEIPNASFTPCERSVEVSEVLAVDAETGVRAEYHGKSQRALSTLVMAISTPQLYLVTSCEKPKDV